MENKCEHRDTCLVVTLDGSCGKETCFTYRLMQKLEKIKSICTPICQIPDEYCGMKNVYQEDKENVEKKILNIIEGEENEWKTR